MNALYQTFEYKVRIFSPEGIRVKGDDLTEKIAQNLEVESNKLAKNGWQILSLVPTVSSEGSVSKLLVTFQRSIK